MSQIIESAAIPVRVYPDRPALGKAAAHDVAAALRTDLAAMPAVRMVFASAPSQDAMLAALADERDIDWSRVIALHMDEYVDLPADAPQRFGRYLQERLFDRVHPGRVELIGALAGPAAEADRYAGLVKEGPIDIVCLGIGENGHIAFNDPPLADFADPRAVRVVSLSEQSRQQQVNDGCFGRLAEVPTQAITLTIPSLFSGRRLFCSAPGATKAAAVRDAVHGPIDPACPASILRRHPSCAVYLDEESAAQL
jgi:glucosamine-6-phosphate deaminase